MNDSKKEITGKPEADRGGGLEREISNAGR
jgi:hypothetical protein